jgi:hypothetical protein
VSFHWESRPEDVFGHMAQSYERALYLGVRAVLTGFAPQIEAWMKANAPWSDKTGNARQALYTALEENEKHLILIADHGMEYGIFLETIKAGQWGIVAPAIDHFAPQIFNAIRQLIK